MGRTANYLTSTTLAILSLILVVVAHLKKASVEENEAFFRS